MKSSKKDSTVAFVGNTAELASPGRWCCPRTGVGEADTQCREDFGGDQRTPINCTSKVTGWPASGWLKSKRTALSFASITAPA